MSTTWTAPGASLRAPRCALAGFLLATTAASDAGLSSLVALPLIAITATFGAACKRDLLIISQQHPPRKTSRGRRERNARSLADFLSVWLAFLSHLAAVAVCARALSATADHVTAGKSRRWLFGYETRALGEPWPDVLGVTIVIVICAMFMCGLESTSAFTILAWISIAFSSNLLIFIGFAYKIRDNREPPILPTWFELISSGSICSYAFPTCFPEIGPKSKFLRKAASMLAPLCVCLFAAFCVCQITNYRQVSGSALPLLRMLEVRDIMWAQPALASCLVVGASLSLTRLYPELFSLLAALASPEWKVLTRSLTYESSSTGSLVLAVFTAGSLSAILAFACPLSHLMTLMNASPLLAFIVEAMLLLVLRCSPNDDEKEQPDVEYKRLSLGKAPVSTAAPTASSASSRSALWFLPNALRQVKSIDNLKQKANKDSREERECLLLDEYGTCGSGAEVVGEAGAEEFMGGERGAGSGGEGEEGGSVACAGSGSDSSTDIDAAVMEYRDRVKVVTSDPERAARVRACTWAGARYAAAGATLALGGATISAVALKMQLSGLFTGGIILCISGGIVCGTQASGTSPVRHACVACGCLLLATLHVAPLLVSAWPALLLFVAAGVVMFFRCTHWCSGLGRVEPTRRLRRAPARRLLAHTAHGEPNGVGVSNQRRLLPTSALSNIGSKLTHVDTVYITR